MEAGEGPDSESYDEVGQAIFRGYEELDDQGRDQLKSFTDWLNEQRKKKNESGNA